MATVAQLNFAASLLCDHGKIISGGGHQLLLESNDKYLHMFKKHAINRNVDPQWVQEMKIELLKTIACGESMTLTLAIDTRDIEVAIKEPDTEIQGGFKAIILDGQHRWEAMVELKKSNPGLHFNLWLVVYVVSSDSEIEERLKSLNKRRTFSQADTDKVNTLRTFLKTLNDLVTDKNANRRCVQNIRNSAALKSETFLNAHKFTSDAEFKAAMIRIAAKYKQMYEEKIIADSKFARSVVADVVNVSKLYQLIEDPAKWLQQL